MLFSWRTNWRPTPWQIRTTNEGWLRAETFLNGQRIFFETRDGALAPSAEAMGSLLLLPCLRLRCCARIPGRVDAEWRANTNRLAQIFGGWFGWDTRFPLRCRVAPRTRSAHAETRQTGRAAPALAFFTGGVDSLHTLLYPSISLRALVYVAGFDVLLKDTERLAWIERSLRENAHRRGLEAVFLRSNIRNWKELQECDWARVHGAALACAGHLLSGRFTHVLVPSTAPHYRPQHTGSNHLVDPLWSSSGLRFVYDGGDYNRSEKIARIADSAECKGGLRVCWRNVPGTINCGTCEKCVRTQLAFFLAGHPLPKTFPEGNDLTAAVLKMEAIPRYCAPLYREFLEEIDAESDLAAAVRVRLGE